MFKLDNAFYFFKGRVALYAILKVMGITKGDEVIVQAFTCLAVPNPIICLGAKPVYVDIDSKTYNMDTSKIEERLTEKTKVIIAQHTYGVPVEMDKILEIARRHNLYVIEDSCHTIGSKYKGKETGLFGDASFFSFGWSKPITAGAGGCAIINNQEIKKRMEKIYTDFIEPSLNGNLVLKFQYFSYSIFLTPSLFWFVRGAYRALSRAGIIGGTFNSDELKCKISPEYKKKMPKWQKNLLLKELNRIENTINHRKWVVSKYEKMLPEINIKPMNLPEYYDPVYLRYPILVKDKNRILTEAQKNKIELGDWFISPIHPMLEKDWKLVDYRKDMCPVAEETCKKLITLPTYRKVREQDILKIIDFLKGKNYS